MFTNIVINYGKTLYQTCDNPPIGLGYNWVKVYYRFIITKSGEIEGVELVNESKLVPLSVGDGFFSDYHRHNDGYPYLLSEQLKSILNNGLRRDNYIKNLDNLIKYMGENEELEAFRNFIGNKENIIQVLNEKKIEIEQNKYFYCVFSEGSSTKELFLEPAFRKKISEYFFDQMRKKRDEKTKICEITGEDCSFYMKGHSMLGRGMVKGKVISSKIYNDFYAGKYEKYSICNIGAETTAFLNMGFLNLLQDARSKITERYIFLGTFTGKKIDLEKGIIWRLKENGYESLITEHFNNYLDNFKKEFLDEKLFYVEFDFKNKGRASIYKAYSFSKKESQKIINNICEWFQLTTIFSFNNHLISALPSLTKLVCLVTGRDARSLSNSAKAEKMYSDYYASIIHGDFEMFFDRYLSQMLEKNRHMDLSLAELFLEIEINIKKRGLEMEDKLYTTDFLAGKLLAYGYVLENKYNYLEKKEKTELYLAEKEISNFQKSPYDTWVRIRSKLQYFVKKHPIELNSYVQRIEQLEYFLINEYGFRKSKFLTGEMYLGYAVAKKELQKKRKEQERGYEKCIIIDIY